jgi:hypothetical protein
MVPCIDRDSTTGRSRCSRATIIRHRPDLVACLIAPQVDPKVVAHIDAAGVVVVVQSKDVLPIAVIMRIAPYRHRNRHSR